MTQSPTVVITGIGLVTPVGLTAASTWQALQAGTSGIKSITSFDAQAYAAQIAGEIVGFDPEPVLSSKDLKRMDRFIQLGMVAVAEALGQAGLLELDDDAKLRIGAYIGSGIGGMLETERMYDILRDKGPSRISPFFIPAMLPNMLAGQASLKYGLKGPNVCPVSACATGAHAIGEAMKIIQRGEADMMVAGGAEACVCGLAVGGFAAARALSTQYNHEPTQASRPFDANRDGFVMAEGAGILILERLEHAQARGAVPIAEVAGFGQTADAYHMTMPHETGEGGARAIEMALADADISPADVGYVNAHATSTPGGDVIESQTIKNVFGPNIAVSAIKSMTGHMLGAAGSVEAAVTALALRDGVLPPTINLDEPGEGCELDYIPHQARQAKVQAALSNSFGFGGTNASLIIKAC